MCNVRFRAVVVDYGDLLRFRDVLVNWLDDALCLVVNNNISYVPLEVLLSSRFHEMPLLWIC